MATDALFEIGLEELPARFIDDAEKQLHDKTAAWLETLRISFTNLTTYSTPRRLAVLIEGLAEQQMSMEEEVKGPAEKIAKDETGNWTKAAVGFTKGQGKTTDDIYTKPFNGTTYIFVKKHIEGKNTIDLLPGFKDIITSINFGKNMRWGTQTMRYARPIRWLVGLFGSAVVPFEIANVASSNTTFGHRFLGTQITINEPKNYEEQLHQQFVIVDAKKREAAILQGIRELEQEQSVHIPIDKELLNEVRNLVEFPQAFLGSYKREFLSIPEEVLIISMKEHQRYFPVRAQAGGELLPYFVGIRNGDDTSLDTVIKGNEKVLHARLSDAAFFYDEDRKRSMKEFLTKLKRVVFQEDLGTIHEKVERVIILTRLISQHIELPTADTNRAVRAAEISKFDLTTSMVNEFTELQGVMGEKYAAFYGEDAIVAQAIREHYLPKSANGALPETAVGTVVSIADKLDTIIGCISVGLVPTGSHDPYGLRRQAIGILRMVHANKWDISVEKLIELALQVYATSKVQLENQDQAATIIEDFFLHRAAYILKETGIEQDIIHAVLHQAIGNFTYSLAKAEILSSKRNDETFKLSQEAFVRVLNLAQKADSTVIDPALLKTVSEKALYEKYYSVNQAYHQSSRDAKEDLQLLEQLTEPIHQFFDQNMVMVDEDNIRKNRLALLHQIGQLIYSYADVTKIEWKQSF
ncbi:glycine--tRNA ligase subunit beta [Virgibacillus pantothenticus]|uniref:Glycine--tRNA ligase beta subunit n=1 Tax=Virgibacillus pantothenticus TaxID=1473 RepID=A0A0L0QPJ2_VIRPA|nr:MULTISPECIES: glycine--tRNA ligase subunit beta [Virgibacillus]API90565.1 glycine--tRNA ligase subunit beta [Virgibacillus sp. 6R]KNE20520.1 glycine-tRNA synthetase subunit beta [Virgibacillus pantothenticus]MBS7429677.1 glycine--tRNA ligase subunit beta [Virgibacillus sp. 19R1-5]MBU8565552.1 glycine--tRNA ligase subunit beta [Virgibacillus pantothenticus]MBU8599850.1 glycine--tRNA ligase subunit beta [Virgibacillus pantothenticus]